MVGLELEVNNMNKKIKEVVVPIVAIIVALFVIVGDVLFVGVIIENMNSKKVEDKYPLDLSFQYEGKIPTISRKDSRIPLGVKLPEVQNEWAEGVEPLFLYTHPELWEKTFLIEGLDWVVAKVDNYYLALTPMGPVGPVWAYCHYSDFGKFYGITSINHAFLFLHQGELKVVKAGHNFQEVAGVYRDMDLLEQQCVFKGNEVSVETPTSRVEIDSWSDALVKNVEEIGVDLIANTKKEYFNVDVVQIFDGEKMKLPGKNGERMFWVQKTETGESEAMFVGAIDNRGVLYRIPFRGEILEINEYGIRYKFGDTERFTPFSPVIINGELFFAEYSPEFFEAIKGYYLQDTNAPEGENET